jgi:upstream activation factor subunit UAF30
MPRQSKSKTSDVPETSSVTPIETPIETQTTIDKVVKPKKVKTPKVEVTSSEVETVIQPSVDITIPTLQEDIVDSVDLSAQTAEFLSKLNQISSLIGSLKTEYRTLEKKWLRELKTAQKTSSKKKRKSGNRAPSGFVKPTRISDELAKFLEKPTGSEMARTDVTREINKYIRSQNLQDKENGRKINPDSKLQSLLKLKKTDELTYFNLQRYMSPHFAKSVKEVVVA